MGARLEIRVNIVIRINEKGNLLELQLAVNGGTCPEPGSAINRKLKLQKLAFFIDSYCDVHLHVYERISTYFHDFNVLVQPTIIISPLMFHNRLKVENKKRFKLHKFVRRYKM